MKDALKQPVKDALTTREEDRSPFTADNKPPHAKESFPLAYLDQELD